MNVRKSGMAIAIAALMTSGLAWADTSNDAFGSDDVASHNDLFSDNTAINTTNTTTNTAVATDLSDNGSYNDTNSNNAQLLSNNTDNSVDDSGNMDDSYNTDNSVDDSGNMLTYTDDSFNTTNTTSNSAQWNNSANMYNHEESYEISIEADTVVASASLTGSVGGVGVNYTGGFLASDVDVRNVNSLSGMNGVAGITTVSQNSGANSLTQQAVSTNASVFTN
ncbi:hypothetical protein [Vibrio fluvialis]|uniref:hypothetical protein n=1 Tax=Vibrio fluvialis TaxID=676 RepID=UPI001EEA7E7B|nr:hypothetical protein [Vibrio fluvialis]ELL9330602.1 hypothetical protein [Vibrio fluvialis]MCG6348501.1 hypothetical protein [Vibrio fluvialis]MDZ5516698.1 hypothetical protein [Vibrio fluvialis]